jgi:hypothetical protein
MSLGPVIQGGKKFVSMFFVEGLGLPTRGFHEGFAAFILERVSLSTIDDLLTQTLLSRLFSNPQEFDVQRIPVTGRAKAAPNLTIYISCENKKLLLVFDRFEIRNASMIE